MDIGSLKKQLVVASTAVFLAAFALLAATYAWYVSNSTVQAKTSTISAMTNNMVLQIVEGTEPNHGGNECTIASASGHEISPSSTNDAVNWFVPKSWEQANVATYEVPSFTGDIAGQYKQGGSDFYAYALAQYTLYTVKETGKADVYLDGSLSEGPVTISKSAGASEEWFNKIKGSLRVGIVVDSHDGQGDKLKVVYAPIEPSKAEAGNDVHFTKGWSCVNQVGDGTQPPTYMHLSGTTTVDQNGGDWAATKTSDNYVSPANNPMKIAENVDYNGVSMKIFIWMEGTDSDCVNMSGLDTGTDAPTFNVTLTLAGIQVA